MEHIRKLILIVCLMSVQSSTVFASYMCHSLFFNDTPVKKSIYQSKWWIDSLYNNENLEKILSADPSKDHIPFLEMILKKAIKEFESEILKEFPAAYTDVSSIYKPQYQVHKALAYFGFLKPKEFQVKVDGQRVYSPVRIEIYIFLRQKIYQAIRRKQVTRVFYEAVANVITQAYRIDFDEIPFKTEKEKNALFDGIYKEELEKISTK